MRHYYYDAYDVLLPDGKRHIYRIDDGLGFKWHSDLVRLLFGGRIVGIWRVRLK